MHVRTSAVLWGAALFVMATAPGCGKDDGVSVLPSSRRPEKQAVRPNAPGQVELASGTIGSEGGTIRVDRPGDPLHGLTIEVPAGAWTDSRRLTVSSSPLATGALGPRLVAASPRISVDGASEGANGWMRVRVPVSVPPARFVAGFALGETPGSVEPLRLVQSSPSEVVFETAHFSDVVAASVADGDVSSVEPIDSGYRIGVDNWQFPNRGSFLSPKGICAGMSVTSMWYFEEKRKKGRDSLFGHDDNDWVWITPKIWEDDVEAIRFASVMQVDYWEGLLAALVAGLQFVTPASATLGLLKLAMKPGEPQLVVVGGRDPDGKWFRHALVAYRIVGDRVFLCDPNHPKSHERFIEVVNGAWTPYAFGAATAADPGIPCNAIEYFPRSSFLWDSRIRRRFGEMMDKTIGKDRFPEFSLEVQDPDGNWIPFVDGYKCPPPGGLRMRVVGSFSPDVSFYGEDEHQMGERVQPGGAGRRRVGVAVRDQKRGWVGFRWIFVEVPDEELTYRIDLDESIARWKKASHPTPPTDPAERAAWDQAEAIAERTIRAMFAPAAFTLKKEGKAHLVLGGSYQATYDLRPGEIWITVVNESHEQRTYSGKREGDDVYVFEHKGKPLVFRAVKP
jgi:hypothetical protein